MWMHYLVYVTVNCLLFESPFMALHVWTRVVSTPFFIYQLWKLPNQNSVKANMQPLWKWKKQSLKCTVLKLELILKLDLVKTDQFWLFTNIHNMYSYKVWAMGQSIPWNNIHLCTSWFKLSLRYLWSVVGKVVQWAVLFYDSFRFLYVFFFCSFDNFQFTSILWCVQIIEEEIQKTSKPWLQKETINSNILSQHAELQSHNGEDIK